MKNILGICLAVILAMGITLTAPVVGPVAPAQAATNCSLYKGSTMVSATCTSGGGRYQAIARCTKGEWWAIGPKTEYRFGWLVKKGWTSIAVCHPGYYVSWASIGHTA